MNQNAGCERRPEFRRDQRDENKQPKESLSDTRVKDADLIFHHRDSKTAQNSLQNHTDNRDHAQATDPSPVVAQPKPHSKDDRENSDQRTHQSMRVLEQNSADPF